MKQEIVWKAANVLWFLVGSFLLGVFLHILTVEDTYFMGYPYIPFPNLRSFIKNQVGLNEELLEPCWPLVFGILVLVALLLFYSLLSQLSRLRLFFWLTPPVRCGLAGVMSLFFGVYASWWHSFVYGWVHLYPIFFFIALLAGAAVAVPVWLRYRRRKKEPAVPAEPA